jgi:hypothetical protein
MQCQMAISKAQGAGFGFKIENDICPSAMERLKPLG